MNALAPEYVTARPVLLDALAALDDNLDSLRSIIDAFRIRHLEGADLAKEALKRWLRRGGQPSELLALARSFPRAQSVLRQTLEILL